jgi:hypothetical protein
VDYPDLLQNPRSKVVPKWGSSLGKSSLLQLLKLALLNNRPFIAESVIADVRQQFNETWLNIIGSVSRETAYQKMFAVATKIVGKSIKLRCHFIRERTSKSSGTYP